MDVNTIKEAIDQGVLVGCGLGLAGLGFFAFAMWLRRVPGRVCSFAKKAGWATVAVLFSFGVWATANSYLTQEEKDDSSSSTFRIVARGWRGSSQK